jgi:hypothetical protein
VYLLRAVEKITNVPKSYCLSHCHTASFTGDAGAVSAFS